jgi:geranylgeranyl diphosphate synthase, type I
MQSKTTSAEKVALAQLAEYKAQIDADIRAYCQKSLKDIKSQYGLQSRDAMAAFYDFLSRGGKRLRGSLVMNTYQMCGGTDQGLALRVARIIEIINAYLLAIDDVIDCSDTRRGGPTVHRLMESYHQRQHMHGNSAKTGESIAIITALAGAHDALRQIGDLPIDGVRKIKLLNHLNDTLLATAHGQLGDIFNETLQDVDEANVKKVLTLKTAYYTFWNPIVCGGILAGEDVARLEPLRHFSVNTGLCFQITDDILGTFGNVFESGKSAMDDLHQGKITILVTRTLSQIDGDKKQYLLSCLGNPRIGETEHAKCMQIIKDCGALDYARHMADQYAHKAVSGLNDLPNDWQTANTNFFKGLASYIASRKA